MAHNCVASAKRAQNECKFYFRALFSLAPCLNAKSSRLILGRAFGAFLCRLKKKTAMSSMFKYTPSPSFSCSLNCAQNLCPKTNELWAVLFFLFLIGFFSNRAIKRSLMRLLTRGAGLRAEEPPRGSEASEGQGLSLVLANTKVAKQALARIVAKRLGQMGLFEATFLVSVKTFFLKIS